MSPAKSTKSPAFQWYPGDYLSSSKVQRMSMTERGIYQTLLSVCWLDRGLSTDLGVLARLVSMRRPQFERIWSHGPLHECFVERDGKLHNPRLDRERKAQHEFRQKQKANADKRWHPSGNATALPSVASPRDASGNALHLQSSSSSSTSSSLKSVRTPRATDPPLVTPHKQHRNIAHFSALGDVPRFVHEELVRKVANGGLGEAEADRQVRAFYADTEAKFAGHVVGDEAPKFWRAQFAASVKSPEKAMSSAAASVFATLGVKPS